MIYITRECVQRMELTHINNKNSLFQIKDPYYIVGGIVGEGVRTRSEGQLRTTFCMGTNISIADSQLHGFR
jgi:hypothetical protein